MNASRLWIVTLLVIGCLGKAEAIEENQVALHGGTVNVVPAGTIGVLDLSGQEAIVFRAEGKEIRVPYAGLKSVEATSELARHLGIVPAIGAGLVRSVSGVTTSPLPMRTSTIASKPSSSRSPKVGPSKSL